MWVSLVGAVCTLLSPPDAAAQEMGHKLLGTIGVNAGTQPEPGLYVLERLALYDADRVRDRDGQALPVLGLDIDVVANVLGLAFTVKLASGPYYTAAFGAPLADVSVNADEPHLALGDAGFGDLFLQPLKLGYRFQRADVVGGYAVYVPTGHFEAKGANVGRGFWTHELSAGGAVYFGENRAGRVSLLASYDLNGSKRDIDIRRGNTVQIQGGAGTRVREGVEMGLAGFALWQVTDNSGAELPEAVRGALTRAFGVGPEVGATVPALRTRFDLRAEWELDVSSRQQGWIFVGSATFVGWRSAQTAPPRADHGALTAR